MGMFELNNTTGALSVNTQLDRDSKPLTDVNGVCSVTVQVNQQNFMSRKRRSTKLLAVDNLVSDVYRQ